MAEVILNSQDDDRVKPFTRNKDLSEWQTDYSFLKEDKNEKENDQYVTGFCYGGNHDRRMRQQLCAGSGYPGSR